MSGENYSAEMVTGAIARRQFRKLFYSMCEDRMGIESDLKYGIDEKFIDAVEQECGHGAGGWDMVDPREIAGAVLTVWERKRISHIAREGEQEFAAIMRNRSGHDAGCIDYGVRVELVANLSAAEKKEIVRTSEALTENIKRLCNP